MGRRVPGEQVLACGRELAAMLGKIHEEGFVYRDLKTERPRQNAQGLVAPQPDPALGCGGPRWVRLQDGRRKLW